MLWLWEGLGVKGGMLEKAPVKTRWLTGARYIAPGDLERSETVKKTVDAMRELQSKESMRSADASRSHHEGG